MNDYEYIKQLIPDYINGALNDADRILVENAIASSPDFKVLFDEFLLVFESLNKEEIKQLMDADSESVQVMIPRKSRNIHKVPTIIIGFTTSVAACLLLWIGISEQQASNSFAQKSKSALSSTETIDDEIVWELYSEDVEEAILDDVLTLYISDIETGKEINPLLEEEITEYLLKEHQDDETL